MTEIRLDGGELCLDFTNTIHNRSITPPEDYLGNFKDLLDWLGFTGALPRRILLTMKVSASVDAERARRAFKSAIAFRKLLYTVFSSVAHGPEVPEKEFSALSMKIGRTLANLRLHHEGRRVVTSWAYRKGNLEQALWPIAKSAMDLLLSGDFDRIKQCPRCFWLFHDTTKNSGRKWCSVQTCGRIDKAARYYYRKKAETRSATQ